MSIPMLQHTTILDAAAATVTKDLSDTVLGQVRFARAIFLEINGSSTPNWTLDIQGKASQGATWHNIDYFRTDQGAAVTPSVAQLTVNWTTAQHYVIPEPPPFVRLVATRTGGNLTIHGAFSSEAYSVPFAAVTLGASTSTVGVVRTEGLSYLNIAAGQATTVVKASAGVLHSIILNSAAAATNTTVVYDNAAGAGTVIGRPAVTTATVPTTLLYDVAFANGLTIITATANGGDMTVCYR